MLKDDTSIICLLRVVAPGKARRCPTSNGRASALLGERVRYQFLVASILAHEVPFLHPLRRMLELFAGVWRKLYVAQTRQEEVIRRKLFAVLFRHFVDQIMNVALLVSVYASDRL